MSNKLLFGKSLSAYDDEDIDELLSKLTEEEIKELNDDLDPDNSLLPPSQRCRDQTTKLPTGPFDRKKLIRFLIDKAKSEKDWDEAVPYEKKVRGKIFEPKKQETQISSRELSEMGFDIEFDHDVDEALVNATEEELVDLAAVLGFTGMLNQVQFHASLENRQQECGGFTGVAKAEKTKLVLDEPPNDTNIEESIKKLEANDEDLTILNLNNIKTLSAEVIKRLFTAISSNTQLKSLSMASTRLTNSMAEPILQMLEKNKSLNSLNLESNFLSGDFLIRILEASSHEKSGITDFHLANQRQSVLGVKVEQALTRLVLDSPRLLRLGIDFETAHARVQIREHLKENFDRATRLSRKR